MNEMRRDHCSRDTDSTRMRNVNIKRISTTKRKLNIKMIEKECKDMVLKSSPSFIT